MRVYASRSCPISVYVWVYKQDVCMCRGRVIYFLQYLRWFLPSVLHKWKMIVYSKIKSVIIYSRSCHSKPVWRYFLCRMQEKTLKMFSFPLNLSYVICEIWTYAYLSLVCRDWLNKQKPVINDWRVQQLKHKFYNLFINAAMNISSSCGSVNGQFLEYFCCKNS